MNIQMQICGMIILVVLAVLAGIGNLVCMLLIHFGIF